MSRVNIVLCGALVLLVAIGSTVGHGYGRGRGYGVRRHHHHRHGHGHHHRYTPSPTLTLYDPKGMEAYIRSPCNESTYFALNITVNPTASSGTPDVSLNTSVLVYGKYIVNNTQVIIKEGDFLKLSWAMGFASGNATSGDAMLRVHRGMIQRNCSCATDHQNGTSPVATTRAPFVRRSTTTPKVIAESTTPKVITESTTAFFGNEFGGADFDQTDSSDYFDCEIDPSTNLCRSNLLDVRTTQVQPQKLVAQANRDDEVRTLEAIIDTLLGEPCRSKPRTTKLTLAHSFSSGASTPNLVEYVRGSVSNSPKLKELANSKIRSASLSRDVIVFEMASQLDKLMMLQLCKDVGMSSVKDYDQRR